MRGALARMVDAHRRTLDQLSTGVAMFGADHRLTFYNAAYRALWDLDAAYLDQGPTDSAVLEALRSARKLPEEQDFRQWKAQLSRGLSRSRGQGTYLASARRPHRARRHHAQSGRRRHLSVPRRHRAARSRPPLRGTDPRARRDARQSGRGRRRVRKRRPASPAQRGLRAHVAAIAAGAGRAAAHRDHHGAVPAAARRRRRRGRRCANSSPRSTAASRSRRGSSAATAACVDCTTVPLPDGATLVTFHDVTDSVNVERALRERNEALEDADKIKIDFVHHVSYELRSPLTNIIGFVHLLGDPGDRAAGRQAARISRLHHRLHRHAAGADQQHPRPRHHRRRPHAAQSRAGRYPRTPWRRPPKACRIGWSAPASRSTSARRKDIGSFTADERRVRQILFNLLANAVSFSPPGATITLRAERRADAVVFAVTDRGPGHSVRGAGKGVRLVRIPFARLAASRPGTRPFAGALVRRAARRHGQHHLGCRRGHDCDMYVSARRSRQR